MFYEFTFEQNAVLKALIDNYVDALENVNRTEEEENFYRIALELQDSINIELEDNSHNTLDLVIDDDNKQVEISIEKGIDFGTFCQMMSINGNVDILDYEITNVNIKEED